MYERRTKYKGDLHWSGWVSVPLSPGHTVAKLLVINAKVRVWEPYGVISEYRGSRKDRVSAPIPPVESVLPDEEVVKRMREDGYDE